MNISRYTIPPEPVEPETLYDIQGLTDKEMESIRTALFFAACNTNPLFETSITQYRELHGELYALYFGTEYSSDYSRI